MIIIHNEFVGRLNIHKFAFLLSSNVHFDALCIYDHLYCFITLDIWAVTVFNTMYT